MCPLGALGPHVVCAHNVFTMCPLGIWVLVPSVKYKYVHVRHQAPNTRSRNLLNRINVKIDTIAAKYRRALTALQALDTCGKSEWRSEFHKLRKQDVRYLSQAELPKAPTQERTKELHARTLLKGVAPKGNRMISWIWQGSLKDQVGEDGYNEGLSSISP